MDPVAEAEVYIAYGAEDADFDANDRAAIIMTNQSKWLIAAYAVFGLVVTWLLARAGQVAPQELERSIA